MAVPPVRSFPAVQLNSTVPPLSLIHIFQPAEFTGLDNYVTLFNDKYFPVSIKNTAVMSFSGMPIGLVVALALAVLLSKEVKGMPAFRTIYYLPTVVPIVASAMLFL